MEYNEKIWEVCPYGVRHDIDGYCLDTDRGCYECFKNHNISQDEVIDYIVDDYKREIEDNKSEINSCIKTIENSKEMIVECKNEISRIKNKIEELPQVMLNPKVFYGIKSLESTSTINQLKSRYSFLPF